MWLQRQHPSTPEVSAWRMKEEQLLLPYSAPPSRMVSIRQICRIAVASGGFWMAIQYRAADQFLLWYSLFSIQ
jgi:hypothetical protein